MMSCTPIDAENAALADDIARLQRENSQLLHARLTRERALLAEQNAMLLQSASFRMPSVSPSAPPGLAPPLVPPGNKWLAVDVSRGIKGPWSSTSSVVSTEANSSLISSLASSTTSSVCDDANEVEVAWDPSIPRTTLMLRNIPNCYTRSLLLELLDERGFRGSYNLVYLPIDFNTSCGFGYAFVNFVSMEHAEVCMSQMQGFQGWNTPSDKVLDVTWSNAHQGFEAHVERYRNSPMMHETVPDELKPVIFVNGERVAFPQPTKKPRAPRTRRRP